MVDVDANGYWTDAYRAFVDSIRDSEDVGYVLAHLHHPDVPVRVAVAEWFGYGDAHWAQHGIDPTQLPPRMRHAPMPDDVAAILLRDADPTVGTVAALRVNDVSLLVETVLDPSTHAWVRPWAMDRLLTLERLDDLLSAASPQRLIPMEAAKEMAKRTTRTDVLDDLLAIDALRDELLANPALTSSQRAALIGVVLPGRPQGDPEAWAVTLRATAGNFALAADWPNPGGFEAAELRECGPAGGRLLAAAAPLCAAAADALPHEAGAPLWVREAITWALELTRAETDPKSIYPRLGISPKRVTPDDIPEIPTIELRNGARALRNLASVGDYGELAAGAATLLNALADGGGSLQCLRRYGGGNGYDDLHVIEILALAASAPLRTALMAP